MPFLENSECNQSQSCASIMYHKSGFECVVKQLWMVLYKEDCDSNDCELPSRQATPSTLDKGVACGEAACGVDYY